MKPRILILNYEFPPLGGGGGVAAHVLAKGFIQNGYDVDYLTTGFKGLPKYEVIDGIHIHRVAVLGRTSLPTASLPSLLSFPLAALLKGISLCRTHKYAFINTHFVVPTGPLGYVLSTLFTIPNVLSLHGGDIFDPSKSTSPHKHAILRAAIRFLMERADRLVAQSNNTKANAQVYYHPRKEIEIIPLAYEAATYVPATRAHLGLKEGKTYLIGVGRLVTRKDFGTLIRALQYLDENYEVIIVGDGPERTALETVATDTGVLSRVTFAGSVTNERKFQLLENANVFVLSSLHEGFGIVLQEAMQARLPIVATNVGGQTDLIKEGVNGYLVSVGDEKRMAEAVVRACALSRASIADQLTQYTPSAIAHAYSHGYDS